MANPYSPLRTRIVASLALSVLILAGCSLASEPVPAGPIQRGPLPGEAVSVDVPLSLPSVANGAQVYLLRCSGCHGVAGTGDSPEAAQLAQQGALLPDFSDPELARSRSPQEWYRIVTDGNIQNLMPPWRDALSASERWDVTYFLYSLSMPDGLLAQGEVVYAETCAECHGESGELAGLDNLSAMAELSPQDVYEEYVTGGDDGIHIFADQLSEDARWAVAFYARTFSYDASLTEEVAEEEAAVEEEPAADEEPVEEGSPPEETEPTEESPQAGTVHGQITNGSAGGPAPGGLEVKLSGVTIGATNTLEEFLSRTTTTDDEGMFSFEDVPLAGSSSAYVVSVIYGGVEFSNGAMVNPDFPTIELPVTIYESTTDPSVVAIEAMHFIIREHPDALLVIQLYVFNNQSDRVYVSPEPVSGGRRGSVAFSLPADAYGITFEDGQLGGRFIQSGDLIYDTRQLLPGSAAHSIIVSYFLPVNGSRKISVPIPYQTGLVNILVQEGGRLRSEQLQAAGVELIENQVYDKYIGQNMAAGDTLSFTVRTASATTNLLPILGIVGLSALVIGGAAYWLVWGRKGITAPVAGELTSGEMTLIRQIAELDEAFEAGHINRFEHEARRAELKATLAEGGWEH